ncbi:MAG: TetR/AcrR family transcriptional regulator [Solirubrobacterales bacterium]
MAERDAQQEDRPQGLPRLPPGRHGLAREFVVKNQRDRLTAGIIAVVAERGYHDATVAQICAAAGVSRRTFYSYFSSKKECFLGAFDLIGEYLTEAMAEAGSEEESWAAKVRARIEEMLAIFAANPDLVRFTLIAPLRAGEDIVDRQGVMLERILSALIDGRPEGGDGRRPSPAIEQAAMGGMIGLITRLVEAGKGTRLPELLPDLVELFLIPYIGREAAARAAHSTA